MVTAIQGGQVKLGLSADPRLLILREERHTDTSKPTLERP